MYHVKSAAWVWHFDTLEDWNLLGPRPEELTSVTRRIKTNPVRGVFARDGFFLKLEMPHCRNPWQFWRAVLFPRARREFWTLWRLAKAGIAVTPPVAYGQALTCSMLITREIAGSISVHDYFEREFVRRPQDPTDFLRRLADFLQTIFSSSFYHPDFHLGNLLYLPERGEFALVDVLGVRRAWCKTAARRRMAMILRELREPLSRAAWEKFIAACGIADPVAFGDELLTYGSRFANREAEKRLAQFRRDYEKFVRVEDGVRWRLDNSRQRLAESAALNDGSLVELDGAAAELQRLWEMDFVLSQHLILRRRAVALADGKLYLEPAGEKPADPAARAELTRRLGFAGLTAADYEFGTDVFGRTVCWPKLSPPR